MASHFRIVERYRMNEEILVQILIYLHFRYFQEVESRSRMSEYECYMVGDPALKNLEST